jgi:hypothetical protein
LIAFRQVGLLQDKSMDEEEFDASFHLLPFGRVDATRADAQFRRRTALGVALWGRNAGDLQRQLLAPYPEIPSGFDLAEFRDLLRSAEGISTVLSDPGRAWLLPLARSSAIISVGTQRFTEWEARCEILRRAIEYLEKR